MHIPGIAHENLLREFQHLEIVAFVLSGLDAELGPEGSQKSQVLALQVVLILGFLSLPQSLAIGGIGRVDEATVEQELHAVIQVLRVQHLVGAFKLPRRHDTLLVG